MFSTENQGRTDFQDIGIVCRGRDQHTTISHFVYQGKCASAIGLPGSSVFDHFNAEIESRTAHIADSFVFFLDVE